MAPCAPLPIQLTHALQPAGVVHGRLLEAGPNGLRMSIPKGAVTAITPAALYRAQIDHRLKRFDLIVRAEEVQVEAASGVPTLRVVFLPGDDAQARAVLPFLLEEARAVA